jgi:hypothetical protein
VFGWGYYSHHWIHWHQAITKNKNI